MGRRVSFWVMAGALYNRTHNNWVRWSTISGECDRWPHTIFAGIQSLLDHPRCIARCLLFQDGARGRICRVSLLVSFYFLLLRNYLPDYRTYYMLRFVFVTCELCLAILAETTKGLWFCNARAFSDQWCLYPNGGSPFGKITKLTVIIRSPKAVEGTYIYKPWSRFASACAARAFGATSDQDSALRASDLISNSLRASLRESKLLDLFLDICIFFI